MVFLFYKKRDIFSSQQHFKTVTKTTKNSVRILTNYTTITINVENLKFNISDIYDILKYIQQRYTNILVSADENQATFSNGDKIYFNGDNVLESIDKNVVIDPDTNTLHNKDNPDEIYKNGRFEFLYDYVLSKIQEINPKDTLTKTKKSIPYISLYMSGIKIPFILYMWSREGLLSTLNRFGIDYLITEDRSEIGEVVVELTDNKFLVLKPNTIRDRLLVNGLFVNKLKYPVKDLNNPEEITQHISDTYGARTIFLMENLTTNMIDPITKELNIGS